MKTPYEHLGLEPSALPDEIRAAYRKLSMKHHPDRGGDTATFQQIKDAYEVLSDPERRLQFDTTGTTNQMMSIRQAAEMVLQQVADAVIASCISPAWEDLHAQMVGKVEGYLYEDRCERVKAEQAAEKFGKLLKRFKRKGGENMIAAALQKKIDDTNTWLDNNMQHQLMLLELLELLKDYSYIVGDLPEPETQLLEHTP